MRSFAIFLGLIGLALAGIAVFAWPAWLLTQSLGFEFKFHRVAGRIAMLVLLVGFVLLARRLRFADRHSLGYGLPARSFLTQALVAMLLGAALMLPILATMLLLDLREPRPGLAYAWQDWAKLVMTGAITGMVVALVEETFLRGAMHTVIARESGNTLAILLTALIYAATHFIGRYRVARADVDAGSGLDMLGGALASFASPLGILDAFLCLTAVGILLGMVRSLTGNIAACVGLHAGWVTVIHTVRETSKPTPGAGAWLMSDYDGFIGWMVLGWTPVIGAILYRWFRPFTTRRAAPPAPG